MPHDEPTLLHFVAAKYNYVRLYLIAMTWICAVIKYKNNDFDKFFYWRERRMGDVD